ncbi:unnamed protein product [Adineta steineri]|uniref:Uncharacterized protein n=1 Tax=Adineta steineri TaxID=433720 RepID=A0A813YLK3_9BILA|nr:unnamed protein product [Adineta steineri]CAF3624873.1 unnamed protein product [Adineta steineri]
MFMSCSVIPVDFLLNTTDGFVVITYLRPYTLYSFDINCSEVMYMKTYTIRTDIFRPSPDLPQGPIDDYRVIIDGTEVKRRLKNTELSYKLNEDNIADVNHTLSIRACNIDTQNRILCSNSKDAEIFYSSIITNNTISPTTQ